MGLRQCTICEGKGWVRNAKGKRESCPNPDCHYGFVKT